MSSRTPSRTLAARARRGGSQGNVAQGNVSRNRPRGSAGFSLLECLIALVLMGLLITGVVQGLLVTVKTAGHNQDMAMANARLTAVAERMQALSTKAGFYTDCATPTQLKAALLADPGNSLTGATLEVVKVEYWGGAAYVGACATDKGAQLVTVKVTVGSDNPAVSSGVVALRNPAAVP